MPDAAPPPPGLLIAVVGPSGAGKDTLISMIARHVQGRKDVHIVRRVITRPAEAGGEDHIPATETEFEAMRVAGAFACGWRAHGLSYGIPKEALTLVMRGHLVIANGSRSALPLFKSAFPRLKVLNVAARPEVLAERLAARGRESREEILGRLSRSGLDVSGDFDVVTIDNSSSLEEAEKAMAEVMKDLIPLS